MKTRKSTLFLFIIFQSLCLYSCAQLESPMGFLGETSDTTESQNEIEQLNETLLNPTTSPTAIPATPTIAVSATPIVELVDDGSPDEHDYCLECHSVKQALIDAAKPEEEIVVENEGEG